MTKYSGEETYTFTEIKQFAEELTEKYGGDVNDTFHNPYHPNEKGTLPRILFAWNQERHAGKRAMEEWYKTDRQHAMNAEKTRQEEKKQKRGPGWDLWEMPL